MSFFNDSMLVKCRWSPDDRSRLNKAPVMSGPVSTQRARCREASKVSGTTGFLGHFQSNRRKGGLKFKSLEFWSCLLEELVAVQLYVLPGFHTWDLALAC